MKIRQGFVSNSSSTAFILDLRTPGVAELVKANSDVDRPYDLNRCTALAVGQCAVEYANDWVDSGAAEYYSNPKGALGPWILKWAARLGTENLVFARESDEEMGGYLINSRQFTELAVAEMEYH